VWALVIAKSVPELAQLYYQMVMAKKRSTKNQGGNILASLYQQTEKTGIFIFPIKK